MKDKTEKIEKGQRVQVESKEVFTNSKARHSACCTAGDLFIPSLNAPIIERYDCRQETNKSECLWFHEAMQSQCTMSLPAP